MIKKVKEIQSLQEKDTQGMFGLILEKKFKPSKKTNNKNNKKSSTDRRIQGCKTTFSSQY